MSNIEEESRLLREIKDIQDELNMVLKVLSEQSQIRSSIQTKTWEERGNLAPAIMIMEPVLDYIIKIQTLQKHAQAIYESVCISNEITVLSSTFLAERSHGSPAKACKPLRSPFGSGAGNRDLETREHYHGLHNRDDFIREYLPGRYLALGAEYSKLPASFMASFFALAINQFPRDSSGMLNLRYVLKYMSKF